MAKLNLSDHYSCLQYCMILQKPI